MITDLDKGGSPIRRSRRLNLGPKALTYVGGPLFLLAGAGLLILLALELRAPQELALAGLAAEAVLAGWLLSGRAAAVIVAGASLCVAAAVLARRTTWNWAAVEVALVAALTVFSHLAAAGRSSSSRLHEQDHRLHELTLLVDAAHALGASLDSQHIVRAALRATVRGLSPADGGLGPHASFHQVAGESVRITQVEDEFNAPVTDFEYPLARNQAARAAIRIGRAAFVRPDHLSGRMLELAERLRWKVLMMAPVYSDKVLIGLLAAAPRDSEVVDRHQLRMLEVLARMTSLALGNAESFQRERHEVVRVETRDRARSELMGQVSHELRELREPLAALRSQLRRMPATAPLSPDRLAELESLIARLDAHAAVDGPTGLPLQEIGMAALERDLARSHRTLLGRHAIAFLSLAPTNGMGEEDLLEVVASTLRARLRGEDLVFLQSRREIVCSFADTNPGDAWRTLSAIRGELQREIGRSPFGMGLAALQHGQSAVDLIQTARAALAKDRGQALPA